MHVSLTSNRSIETIHVASDVGSLFIASAFACFFFVFLVLKSSLNLFGRGDPVA